MFAEALIPINPQRWPAFTAGSIAESEMPEFGDKIQTPLSNIIVAKEYLETSQSDIQWRSRAWQVAEDTTLINMASEAGGTIGSFGAGITANKIADGYVSEMYETAVTQNQQEKLNFEIFKQTAKEKGMAVDKDKVRGTGVTRKYVPEYMQGDICDRPERNARPDEWNNNEDLPDDGIIMGPPSNPGSPSNNDGAMDLPVKSNTDS